MSPPISWIREQTMFYFPAAITFLFCLLVLMASLTYATRWFSKDWPGIAKTILWMSLVLAGGTPSLSAAWIVYNIDFPYPPTEYAPDYSLRDFRKVKVGMSREEVYVLIGRPLCSEVHEAAGVEILRYSRHRTQSDCEWRIRDGFWYRVVELDTTTDTASHVEESYYSSF